MNMITPTLIADLAMYMRDLAGLLGACTCEELDAAAFKMHMTDEELERLRRVVRDNCATAMTAVTPCRLCDSPPQWAWSEDGVCGACKDQVGDQGL